MKKNVWRMLDELANMYPNDVGDKASRESIVEAQDTLSVKFSGQYISFLERYNGIEIKSFCVFGLSKLDCFNEGLWSVIQNTRFYKDDQGWPGIDDWYIISDDGFGNPIGIKPDGSVWLSDHDCGFKQVKLADDFEGFLYKALTETMFEEETEE